MTKVDIVESWTRLPGGRTDLEVKTFSGKLLKQTVYGRGKCPLVNWPHGAIMVRVEKLGVSMRNFKGVIGVPEKMTVRVYHSSYGCETGCCGHVVELNGDDLIGFSFYHPDSNSDEDRRKYAIEFAKETIQKEHPECMASIDWDTVDFEDVSYD